MKYIIILGLLFTTSICFSQNYEPTLQEGKLWTLYYDYGGSAAKGQAEFVIDCDTIINNKTYWRLRQAPPNTSIQGFVREDTSTQQVFFLNLNSTQEALILDYSLQLNDSLNYFGTMIHVDSVDTTPTGQKRIHFDLLDYGAQKLMFIEGEGTSFWGVNYIYHNPSFGYSTHLGVNDTTGYTCASLTSITKIPFSDYFKISPNPVSETLFVNLMNDKLLNQEATIYNISGIQVKQFAISKQHCSISMTELPKGVYFLNIGRLTTIKFIKL